MDKKIEDFLNEKWSEYYNSFQYSFYIFNDKLIFIDFVEDNVQKLIEFDNRIYKKMISIKQNNFRKDTVRKPNKETLQELIEIFENVDRNIYRYNYFFGEDE
jgi:succinate dehydrogenase flavin-adding protein (antitoxin of CptAB toxin-antitoxin module)